MLLQFPKKDFKKVPQNVLVDQEPKQSLMANCGNCVDKRKLKFVQ